MIVDRQTVCGRKDAFLENIKKLVSEGWEIDPQTFVEIEPEHFLSVQLVKRKRVMRRFLSARKKHIGTEQQIEIFRKDLRTYLDDGWHIVPETMIQTESLEEGSSNTTSTLRVRPLLLQLYEFVIVFVKAG